MTESRDQSYYEIALTNRQVMGIFVVLLVCVAVAFFSGLWLGRGAAGPRVATAQPQTIDAGTEAGEEPLAELEFFRRTEQPPQALAPEAEPVAEETPTPQLETPVIIEEIGEPAAEVESARERSGPRLATVEPAEPIVAETAPATPQGEPLPLVVQVFSTTDAEQARQVLERLRAGGYPAQLSPVDVDGRPMYRVRIGPYDERDEATRVADRVRKDFKLDTWITR